MPDGESNGVNLDYGGQAMAFNAPATLFLAKGGHIGEITVPELGSGTVVSQFPRASYRQPMANPVGDRWKDVGPVGADRLGGLLVHAGRLYGSAFIYYDASNTQERSHFSLSLDLAETTGFRGWTQVGEKRQSGFVAGAMTAVPLEWQQRLGGSALTGLCCVPIATRSSFGPAAYSIDMLQIGQPTIKATPLLMYPSDHQTLGPWNGSNQTYGATTLVGGMVIVPGTRSALYFGSNGVGPHCYGDGVWEKSKADGANYCYDPTSVDKGSHAYPYQYQVWAYDLNDFAAVKAGKKRPWDVVPYGVWKLDIPLPATQVSIPAVTIDPATRRIYLAQYKGERFGEGGLPVIWAVDVKTPSK